jgi:hypothetical protein
LSKNAESYSVAAREVHGHAADQEGRIEAGLLEQEGEHAGRGRLAVGARDDQRLVAADDLVGQDLGQADHVLLAIEDDLDLGIAAGERVPDHHEVRVRGHVPFRVG